MAVAGEPQLVEEYTSKPTANQALQRTAHRGECSKGANTRINTIGYPPSAGGYQPTPVGWQPQPPAAVVVVVVVLRSHSEGALSCGRATVGIPNGRCAGRAGTGAAAVPRGAAQRGRSPPAPVTGLIARDGPSFSCDDPWARVLTGRPPAGALARALSNRRQPSDRCRRLRPTAIGASPLSVHSVQPVVHGALRPQLWFQCSSSPTQSPWRPQHALSPPQAFMERPPPKKSSTEPQPLEGGAGQWDCAVGRVSPGSIIPERLRKLAQPAARRAAPVARQIQAHEHATWQGHALNSLWG